MVTQMIENKVKMLAVVRIKGSVGIRNVFKDTMKMLNLKTINNCVVVPDNTNYRGMINKLRDHVTFGEITFDSFIAMLKKRGRLKDKSIEGSKRLNERAAKELGYENIEQIAKDLFEGKRKFKDVNINQTFRLTPPSGGFKSTKQHYPKGDLGYRGEAINELIKKMI